jgi:Txe/YoeB family toxin of Txe-Axe toxin-antitoxin module
MDMESKDDQKDDSFWSKNKMTGKPIYVAFASKKLEKDFEKLQKGRFEDKQLYKFIERAIADLKKDPICGTKIPRKLWPESYIKEHQITNLWKYDLPNAWRLIYTIFEDKVMILNVILEWFSHKDYERKFGY